MLILTLKSPPVPKSPSTVALARAFPAVVDGPETVLETVCEIMGWIWDTTWDTMEDWEDGLLEEIVLVGREEEEDPAIAEETVWDISGCICERMVAIRSDWENEDDPEEEADPEEEDNPEEDDDPDPDVCCPATADVTVWEIRGFICDTTEDTMSDWRDDDELPEDDSKPVPDNELPEEEPSVEVDKVPDNEGLDYVPRNS